MKLLKSCLLILIACLLLAGCAAPLYQNAYIPPGRAAVYFYGEKDNPVAVAEIQCENKRLVNISPGIYGVYFPLPGTNSYSVPMVNAGMMNWFLTREKPGAVPVRMEAGKSYYFRVAGGSFLRVDNASASQEIALCNRRDVEKEFRQASSK